LQNHARAQAALISQTSKLKISPGSHSAATSNGRQQTSQSVVNRWLATLVSTTTSNAWPQKGHRMFSETSTLQSNRPAAIAITGDQKRPATCRPARNRQMISAPA